MGRSHRRATVIGITIPADRRQDIHAWRSQMDLGRTVVREGCQVVVLIRRRDTNLIHGSVTTRVRGLASHIGGIIAGCDDEQNPVVTGFGDFVEQGLGISTSAPGIIQHTNIDARLLGSDREIDRGDGVRYSPRPGGIQKFQAHDLGRPVDARYADRVVPDRANRARDVSPMVVIILGITGA